MTPSGQHISNLSPHLQVRGCWFTFLAFTITTKTYSDLYFDLEQWSNQIPFTPHCWSIDTNLHSMETTLDCYCKTDHRMTDVILFFFSIVTHGHPYCAAFYRVHVLKSKISAYLILSGQKLHIKKQSVLMVHCLKHSGLAESIIMVLSISVVYWEYSYHLQQFICENLQ